MGSRSSSLVYAGALWLAGCSVLVQPDFDRLEPPDPSQTDAGPLDARTDGSEADAPDAPSTCTRSCDDGIACTLDQCNESTGECTHTADSTRCMDDLVCDPTAGCVLRGCTTDAECDDHDACNGVERCTGGRCVGSAPLQCDNGQMCDGVESCDPARGCQPGVAPSCSDGNACTLDRCNPEAAGGAGACENAPVDADGDGYPAASVDGMVCAGGTDCNDSNPNVRPGAREVCNGLDDDCNGIIDDGACAPPNDDCTRADPIRLGATESTSVMGTTVMTMNGVNTTCSDRRGSGGDVWYAITYPATSDLRVEVTPTSNPTMADPVLVLRDRCGGTDLGCNDDASQSRRDARMWLRAGPKAFGIRTVLVGVDAYRPGAESNFVLRAQTSTRLAASSCSTALFDVSAGGTVLAQGPARMGSFGGSCGGGGVTTAEDLYRYDGPTGSLQLQATAASRPTLYTRSGNCATGRETGCGSGALMVNHTMGNATYLFVDGLSVTGTSYQLQVLTP